MGKPKTQTARAVSFAGKALLADLQIQKWNPSILDRKVSKQIANDHGIASAESAGRYSKILGAKNFLAEINSVCGRARTYHSEQTFPWCKTGARILPSRLHGAYTSIMGPAGFKKDFETAADDFAAAFPAMIHEAATRLNGMFNALDYPDPAEVRGLFKYAVHIDPIPTGEDFRCEIQESEITAIRAEIESRTNAAAESVTRDLWDRLHGTVKNAAQKLRDYKTVPGDHFKDSLISNIGELLDILPTLNMSDDPDLDRAADEVRREIAGHSPEALRENDSLRADVAAKADGIAEKMGGFMGN